MSLEGDYNFIFLNAQKINTFNMGFFAYVSFAFYFVAIVLWIISFYFLKYKKDEKRSKEFETYGIVAFVEFLFVLLLTALHKKSR